MKINQNLLCNWRSWLRTYIYRAKCHIILTYFCEDESNLWLIFSKFSEVFSSCIKFIDNCEALLNSLCEMFSGLLGVVSWLQAIPSLNGSIIFEFRWGKVRCSYFWKMLFAGYFFLMVVFLKKICYFCCIFEVVRDCDKFWSVALIEKCYLFSFLLWSFIYFRLSC